MKMSVLERKLSPGYHVMICIEVLHDSHIGWQDIENYLH